MIAKRTYIVFLAVAYSLSVAQFASAENHVRYFPLPIGPGFMVPNTSVLFGGELAFGTSLSTDATWQQLDTFTAYMDVDTTSAVFTETPIYLATLGGGDDSLQDLIGINAIYSPSNRGFRVYVRVQTDSGGNDTNLLASQMNNLSVHVNWIGVFPFSASPSFAADHLNTSGNGSDQAKYRGNLVDNFDYLNNLFFSSMTATDVNLYAHLANRMATYKIHQEAVPDYIEFLIGWASNLCSAHPSTAYPINSEVQQWGWDINLLSAPRKYSYDTKKKVLAVVGSVAYPQWHSGEHPYEKYIDISVSSAGFSETPVIITSLDRTNRTSGILDESIGYTAVVNATASGWRVYLRTHDGSTLASTDMRLNYLAVGRANQLPSCQDACQRGVNRCQNSTTIVGCVDSTDGEPCWEEVSQACPTGTTCQLYDGNYSCICTEVCTVGQKQCLSGTTYRECIRASQAPFCTYWSAAVGCPAGTTCLNGACQQCSADNSKVLSGFQPVMQPLGSNWCWAATMEAIDDYYGGSLSQCEMVSHVWELNQTICCNTAPQLCYPYWAEDASTVATEWTFRGYAYAFAHNGLLMTSVDDVIGCDESPIQAIIYYSGGWGHVEVVIGFDRQANNLYACDSLDGQCYWVNDTVYRSGEGRTWSDSIYRFVP